MISTLLFLGLWSIAVILMVRTMVRKRYTYYSVEIFVRKNFEGMAESHECESFENNLRKCITTDTWQVHRRKWMYLVPWLSFVLKEQGRRWQWMPVSKQQASIITAELSAGRPIKLFFAERLDLPPEGYTEKKKKENVLQTLKKATM